MKKVLLKLSTLALLLTCSVGMWAQQSGTFRIKNVSTNLYFQINESGAAATIIERDESSDSQKFILEIAGNDKYYLKSVSGKYLQAQHNWNPAAVSTADDNCKIALVSQGDGTYGIQTVKGFCGTDATASGSSIYTNKAVSNNGKWEIETIPNFDFEYLVVADGDYTITVDGENYSNGQKVSASKLLIASDIELPSPSVSGYDIVAAVNGFSIVLKSYPSAGSVMGYQVSAVASEPSKSIVPAEWYIVKQSRDGVSPIYDNYSGTNQVMRAAATDQGPAVYDEITSSNAKYLVRFLPSVGNSYLIQFATGNYFKNDNSHVYLTNTIATAGNFLVYPTTSNGSVFGINYTSDGKSYGKKVDNNGIKNGIPQNVDYWESGQVTATSGNNVWQLYAVTLSENIPLVDVVYQYTYDNEVKCSETIKAEVNNAFPAPTLKKLGVKYIIPSLPSIVTKGETITIPVSYELPFDMADSHANISKWYNLSFHMNDNLRYMYYRDGIKFAKNVDTSDAGYMWAFVGDPFAGFQIYNMVTGGSVALDNNEPCGMSSSGTTCKWYLYASTALSESDGGFCIMADGETQYANLQGQANSANLNGGDLKRWGAANEGSTAQVIAAAPQRIVTTTDYGYATMYVNYPVAIPEGIEAYYVTVDGNVAELNVIEGVIPAKTGVVMKGTASTDYEFNYTTAAATTNVTDNQMVGYLVDTPITGSAAISYYAVNYKTVNSEKVPGFFAPKGATTPTGNFTAKAGKAYLKVEGAAGSSIVMRFGDATMVENLLKTQDAAIYDLTGRKVAQPERGIYIVNGKKMFFK